MQRKKAATSIVLSIIIIVIGFLAMKFMISSKKPQQLDAPVKPGALVEVLKVKKEDKNIVIYATGTVQAKKTVDLAPEVSGRVIHVSPGLLSGGYFKEGEVLFEIDPIDYEFAVQKSMAQVTRSEYELAQIESQARVARREWDRIHIKDKEEPNPLVVYEPQMKNAKAGLASAKADQDKMLKNIERTKVRAPFNCMVKTERVEVGQYAMAGQSALSLRGTDAAEIIIPVSFSDLQWLSVPRGGQSGSKAVVKLRAGKKEYLWNGKITRTLGEVDPKGRMIRIVIEIPDPYRLNTEYEEGSLFLAEGLFVEVELQGSKVPDVFSIPAKSLREDTFIWVINEKSELEVRKINVIRREREYLLIEGDLQDGEDLILTYLSGAVPGMSCRVAEEKTER